ncbi:HypC/HybG/HupF family hydrogenase formation chaperone [Candidatus Margulisiibacteriota bacterium]
MCLAIPEKIIKIENETAIVRSGSIEHEVNITFMPKSKIGDYILVHAGFAIQKIDEAEAKKTLKLIEELK